METPKNNIAYVLWNGRPFYVANLPGQGGKDWGYTNRPEMAQRLSEYTARRFTRYQAALGRHATVIEAVDSIDIND